MDNLRVSVLQSLVNVKNEDFTDINKVQYKYEDEDIDMDIDPNELDNDFINDLNYQKLILDQLNNKGNGYKITEWNDNNI